MRANMLHYAVLSPENKILAVKEYRSKKPMDFAEFFDAVYAQDYFLKEDYAQVQVVNGTLEFSLIPTKHFHPQRMADFAGALLKDEFDTDHLQHRDMPGIGATAIYAVPAGLKQKCDHYFQEPEYVPFCLPAIQMASSLSKRFPDIVVVNVFDKKFVVTGMKQGKLHLCNAYDFGGVTDIVYFVQLVLEIIKLQADSARIFVVGEFEKDSELIQKLQKYIPSLEIPSEAFLDRFETRSEKLPNWKYAYLTF